MEDKEATLIFWSIYFTTVGYGLFLLAKWVL